MIIENQQQVTEAVLEAVNRTADPRLRELTGALVRHLHAFAREVKLTEQEFSRPAPLWPRSASAPRPRTTKSC
jgi:hypothetical protein